MCNLFNITWIDLKGFWSIWMFALLVVSGLFCTSMCMYVADEASPMRDVMVIMLGGNGEGHPFVPYGDRLADSIIYSIAVARRISGSRVAPTLLLLHFAYRQYVGMDAGKNDKLPGYILIICSDVIFFNMFAGARKTI